MVSSRLTRGRTRTSFRDVVVAGVLVLALVGVSGCSGKTESGPSATGSAVSATGAGADPSVTVSQPASGSASPDASLVAPAGPVKFTPVTTYKSGSEFNDPSTFPLAVWFESVMEPADVATDKAAGLNTYMLLTANSDPQVAQDNGMAFIAQADEWLSKDHPTIDGWFLADEPDMKMTHAEAMIELARVKESLPKDGRVRYANYGKGVLFWNSEAEAAKLVNGFSDIVSADAYWFTDNNVCSQHEGGALLAGGKRPLTPEECHRAANYGAVIQRVVHLDAADGVRQPVWSFVEVGHPFSEGEWPTITPEQIKAAVWHSIIGGAQGIAYFNHSFGGPCPTQHALREPCYAAQREAVTQTNNLIASLAPVLNSPTATGYAKATGLETLTKYYNGAWYLFTGSDGTTGDIRIDVADGSKVEVVGESRTLTVTDQSFTDNFADADTIHIYKIT